MDLYYTKKKMGSVGAIEKEVGLTVKDIKLDSHFPFYSS